MSTILKALRRLEHDKQAEAARGRIHDPLAPALTATESVPTPPPRHPLATWLAVVGVAAALGAGVSYGLASWWMSRSSLPAPRDVASGTPPAPAPLAAVTHGAAGTSTASVEAPTVAHVAARAPERSAAARPNPVPPVYARRAGAGGIGAQSPNGQRAATDPSLLIAQAAANESDPWEEAAHGTPPPDGSRQEAARTERVIGLGESAGVPSTASQGASGDASSASSNAAAARTAAGGPPVAARPPANEPVASASAAAATPAVAAGGSVSTAAQTPMSRRAQAEIPSLDGTVPISSLPELALPEPPPVVTPPQPAPPQRASNAAVAPPTREPAPTSDASGAPTSRAPSSAAASDSGGKLEIQVLKTVWHPKPERRSAQVRLPDRIEVLEVHQDDVVEGYLVSEITPSSVVLARDEVEFTYRVGR